MLVVPTDVGLVVAVCAAVVPVVSLDVELKTVELTGIEVTLATEPVVILLVDDCCSPAVVPLVVLAWLEIIEMLADTFPLVELAATDWTVVIEADADLSVVVTPD
jgi:hypothetical protein